MLLQLSPSADPSASSPVDSTLYGRAEALIQALGLWGAVVIALIVVLFVIGAWQYLIRLGVIARALRIGAERVRKNRGQRVLFPIHPRHLNQLWSEFLKNRAGATVKDGEQEISTVDPEDVFTEGAVLEGYNRNMALAGAGFFTGLGILGTFLGLVEGLGEIGGAGQDAMMGSILGLLGGMSTAFSTSLVGISASLLWLCLDRALYHRVQKRVEEFFVAVRVAYPVESADQLLHRLLEVEQDESAAIHAGNDILREHGEIHRTSGDLARRHNVLLEEQKAVLQTLGTDLAVAFQESLSNSLGNQVVPLLEGVIRSVETLSTQMGERQVHMIGELVETFQQNLSSQMSGHFEDLAGALKDAAEWQQRVHGDLESLLARLEAATEGQQAVIERSVAACDLYQQSLGELERSHVLIAQSAESLDTFRDRLTTRLEHAAATVDGMAESLTGAVERIDLQARALEERITQLDAQQETYREANEEIRTMLASQLDQLGQQVGELQEFWGRFRDDLAGVGEGLQSSVSEFSVFTADKLREIFARFDAEMAKVVEHLSGTLAEVREVTEDLPAGVERLKESLDSAVTPLSEAGQQLKDLPRSLEGVRELTTAVRDLAPLGDRIREAAQQVSGTDRSMSRLSEQLESTGKQFSMAISVFGAARPNGHDSTSPAPPTGKAENA